MGGELLLLISSQEARELKKSPEKVRAIQRRGRTCLDLGQAGYQIDFALESMAKTCKAPAASLAATPDQDYGDGSIVLRCLSAAKVKRVAAALARLTPADLRDACLATDLPEDDYNELCLPLFKELLDFYRLAAAAGGLVIKTIY